MHSNMKNFQRDIESKLDMAYANGAGGKFGYDDIATASSKTHIIVDNTDQKEKLSANDKKISQIVN